MALSKTSLLFLIFSAFSWANSRDSLDFYGKIVIQGIKHAGPSNYATSETGNNLDSWWGRAVISTDYHTPNLKSFVEVYIYPSDFGYEPLVGATFENDSVSGEKLKVEATEMDIFQLSNAWVCIPIGPIQTKIGRFESFIGQGQGFFGDYIDEDLYSGFNAKGAVHNGLEFFASYGSFFSSVMFQSGDENLNTGRIRLQQSYTRSIYTLDLAYRFNAFDFSRKANDASPEHRIQLATSVGTVDSWRIYLEPATIVTKNSLEEYEFQKVALVGVNIPTYEILDVVALEFEFVPDRTIRDDNGKSIDKSILWNLQMSKSFFDYLNIAASVYGDPLGAKWSDFGFAAQFTSQLW